MTALCSELLSALAGKTLVTAESCTGGGIGAALTGVPGSSSVYKGGIISYTNWVKEHFLRVDRKLLDTVGAVSAPAGPAGDDYGNPVGTVFIGYSDEERTLSREYHFPGSREEVRAAAVEAAVRLVLEMQQQKNA